jgi:hypothetical protein
MTLRTTPERVIYLRHRPAANRPVNPSETSTTVDGSGTLADSNEPDETYRTNPVTSVLVPVGPATIPNSFTHKL